MCPFVVFALFDSIYYGNKGIHSSRPHADQTVRIVTVEELILSGTFCLPESVLMNNNNNNNVAFCVESSSLAL